MCRIMETWITATLWEILWILFLAINPTDRFLLPATWTRRLQFRGSRNQSLLQPAPPAGRVWEEAQPARLWTVHWWSGERRRISSDTSFPTCHPAEDSDLFRIQYTHVCVCACVCVCHQWGVLLVSESQLVGSKGQRRECVTNPLVSTSPKMFPGRVEDLETRHEKTSTIDYHSVGNYPWFHYPWFHLLNLPLEPFNLFILESVSELPVNSSLIW